MRSSCGWASDDGQHGGVPVGATPGSAARIQVAGDLGCASVATRLRGKGAHPCGEGPIGDHEALGPHDDDFVDRALVRQAGVDQFCAASDSGWFVSFESDVRPEPRSVPTRPNDTRTTTPQRASTRPGLRVANSASRRGPNPDPRRAGSGLRD